MIDDYRIRTFLAVAEHGNFTRAARELSLTQPAVTLQIKSLEQELGVSLFDRSGNKIALSEAGKLLLPHAESVHAIALQVRQEIDELSGELKGSLKIGASTTIAHYVVPQMVARFAQRHRKIEFKLLSGNTEQVVDMLEAGQVEIGIIEGVVQRRNLKFELFCRDEIVLIVPADGLWSGAAGDVWTLEQLKLAPLILREPGSGTRSTVERLLKEKGLEMGELNILMETDSSETIKSAVAGGLGVGMVSRFAIARELELKQLTVATLESGPLSRDFQYVLLRDRQLSSIARGFKRFSLAER